MHALEELAATHLMPLCRQCTLSKTYRVTDPEERESIVQSAVLRCVAKLDQFVIGADRFESFFRSIARRAITSQRVIEASIGQQSANAA